MHTKVYLNESSSQTIINCTFCKVDCACKLSLQMLSWNYSALSKISVSSPTTWSQLTTNTDKINMVQFFFSCL
jgi:hypothetical protein